MVFTACNDKDMVVSVPLTSESPLALEFNLLKMGAVAIEWLSMSDREWMTKEEMKIQIPHCFFWS